MTTIEIINELKQLAKTPTAMYALQSNSLVLNYFDNPSMSIENLNVAFRQLSLEDPAFALKYILEPFTYAFSIYLKKEHPVNRWPTTTEVAKAFKALNEHRLCPKFVEKRTRVYTIRKIISSIPEWNSSMSKGVKKQEDRLQDVLPILDPFIAYVRCNYIHTRLSQKEELASFCKFVLSELNLTPAQIENALVSELISKFESAESI